MSARGGVWRLALARVRHERVLTLVLVACLALPLFLPLATRLLVRSYEATLVGRAAATPLVLGARGSRFDLVLDTLFLREAGLASVPWSACEELQARGDGVAIPLDLRFTARGRTVLGTSPEYYELRGLHPARGTLPLVLGDCVLGAHAARALGLGPGDTLFSDPRQLYDLSEPPAVELNVVGVLAPSGGPEDEAVLTGVKTSWLLEGIIHGHADPAEGVDPALVLGSTGNDVRLSEGMVDHQRVTPENLASFHSHGDPGALPLSAVVFVPRDEKAGTLARTRVAVAGDYQMVAPRAVVDELLAIVLRMRALLDRIALLIGVSTVALTGGIVLLSVRIRRGELETLSRIGVATRTLAALIASEVALVLGASLVLVAVALALLALFAPELRSALPLP